MGRIRWYWAETKRSAPRRLSLTAAARLSYAASRQSAGRPPLQSSGGKSGLQTDAAPDNVRRGRPQGRRHRKQTAGLTRPQGRKRPARVKGCGKSAPRGRQRRRHGKPRQEQNRIGATRFAFGRSGALSVDPVARVGCLRRPATGVPEEWPSRRGDKPRPYRTRLTGRLAFASLLGQTRGHTGFLVTMWISRIAEGRR